MSPAVPEKVFLSEPKTTLIPEGKERDGPIQVRPGFSLVLIGTSMLQ